MGVIIVNLEGVPIYSSLSAEETTNWAAHLSQVPSAGSAQTTHAGDAYAASSLPCHLPDLQLTSKARGVVRTLDPQNDLTFLRVRSKKHEIMIAPGEYCFPAAAHWPCAPLCLFPSTILRPDSHKLPLVYADKDYNLIVIQNPNAEV